MVIPTGNEESRLFGVDVTFTRKNPTSDTMFNFTVLGQQNKIHALSVT